MAIKVSGPSALLAVVVVVGVGGFRALTARASLDVEAREQLEQWLVGRYTGEYLATMDQANPTEADADSLLVRSKPEIVDLRARGTRKDMIVRSEIRIGGRPPADGKPVRYWRMEHSMLTGWRLRGEVTALSYYLKLF